MLTIQDFEEMVATGEKIVYAVVYTYDKAKLAEEAGIEILLAGDSVVMNIDGEDDTLSATMDIVIRHAKAVRKGAPDTVVVGDMPSGSYPNEEDAVSNAKSFYDDASVNAIKLEGGVEMAKQIRAIVNADMKVMGHIGLMPQTAEEYKARGRTAKDALTIIEDARAIEEAGAFALLVEAVPPQVTEIIANMLEIPVFGIGAGPYCDGQLLLATDLLGESTKLKPKFAQVYVSQAIETLKKTGEAENLDFVALTRQVFKEFREEVKAGIFPKEKHCYHMFPGEYEKLIDLLNNGPTE